jgi:hypothetical protein
MHFGGMEMQISQELGLVLVFQSPHYTCPPSCVKLLTTRQMIVGYFFESILGLLFALSLAFHKPISTKDLTKYGEIIGHGCKEFFTCAIFFAASIQIACVIVLVRQNFGISANGLGGFTVQITWAVAVSCMLPLIYPMVILNYIEKERSNYRLFLFCGCWLLFFYTFISQMIGYFGPSQVGQGAGPGGVTIITTDEWNTLTSLCLTGVEALSDMEQKVLSGFGAAGSLVVSTYGLGYLLWFIGKRKFHKRAKSLEKKISAHISNERGPIYIVGCILVIIPLLTIPQLWGILRLRSIQRALADATSNSYVDNQWTFGQVVAVMIFASVFTEVGYLVVQKHHATLP